MASEEYLEDRKYILKSLEDTQNNIKKLFENDLEIKVTIATINTRLMVISSVSSMVVGAVVAFVMNIALGGK